MMPQRINFTHGYKMIGVMWLMALILYGYLVVTLLLFDKRNACDRYCKQLQRIKLSTWDLNEM